MGDRRALYDGNTEYFELLERLMGNISDTITAKGLHPPLFHVFSEALQRCPSGDSGIFDEFPSWPVTLDQV